MGVLLAVERQQQVFIELSSIPKPSTQVSPNQTICHQYTASIQCFTGAGARFHMSNDDKDTSDIAGLHPNIQLYYEGRHPLHEVPRRTRRISLGSLANAPKADCHGYICQTPIFALTFHDHL